MNSRYDRDDETRTPPSRKYLIVGVAAIFALVLGCGIYLGTIGPSLPSFGDTAETSQPPGPCENSTIDKKAKLCHDTPNGWANVPIDSGVGITSTIMSADLEGVATMHFGVMADLPVTVSGDPEEAAAALMTYAHELFTIPQNESYDIELTKISGHEAVTASTTTQDTDGEPIYISVTIVDVGDDALSFAIGAVKAAFSDDVDTVQRSLQVWNP